MTKINVIEREEELIGKWKECKETLFNDNMSYQPIRSG